MITRRTLLAGGAAVVGVGAAGVVGWEVAPYPTRLHVRQSLGLGQDPYIPDAPEGEVRLTRMTSQHIGPTNLFTAVPAGHGAGAGLPVIVVMHGASASTATLRRMGLARFVTAAVRAGAPPFVLAGTDAGPSGAWVRSRGADPLAMLRDELPDWLQERGFDARRRALWGWSLGGYGALRYVQSASGADQMRALALFSPALHEDDPALEDLTVLADLPWGLWCGGDDLFHDGALALAAKAPEPPDPWVQGDGVHGSLYWNAHTIEMLRFLAGSL